MLPLALLLITSLLWRPVLNPRYTYYASFGGYLLAGAWLIRLRRPRLRAAIIAAFLCCYAYQLSLALPADTRTPWIRAQAWIHDNASQEDLVLIHGAFCGWEVYLAHPNPPRLITRPVLSYQHTFDLLDQHLKPTAAPNKSVWLVVEPFVYTLPKPNLWQEALRRAGYQYDLEFLPGMNGLFVYQIQRTAIDGDAKAPSPCFDVNALMDKIGIVETQARSAAGAHLAWAHDANLPPGGRSYAFYALDLLYAGSPDLAAKVAQLAVNEAPRHPLGHFAWALALAESGDYEAAADRFSRASALDPCNYFPPLPHFL